MKPLIKQERVSFRRLYRLAGMAPSDKNGAAVPAAPGDVTEEFGSHSLKVGLNLLRDTLQHIKFSGELLSSRGHSPLHHTTHHTIPKTGSNNQQRQKKEPRLILLLPGLEFLYEKKGKLEQIQFSCFPYNVMNGLLLSKDTLPSIFLQNASWNLIITCWNFIRQVNRNR